MEHYGLFHEQRGRLSKYHSLDSQKSISRIDWLASLGASCLFPEMNGCISAEKKKTCPPSAYQQKSSSVTGVTRSFRPTNETSAAMQIFQFDCPPDAKIAPVKQVSCLLFRNKLPAPSGWFNIPHWIHLFQQSKRALNENVCSNQSGADGLWSQLRPSKNGGSLIQP
jgi:hypothetical protein